MAGSFSLFPELAYEIRELIWSFAYPRASSEVCIVRPQHLPTPGSQRQNPVPLTVRTAFPAMMHACREAREFVLRQAGISNIKLIYNPQSDCLIPTRRFDPSLDTLYWPATLYMDFSPYIQGYNGNAPVLDSAMSQQLKHLAIEWGMMHSVPLRFVEYIMSSCPALETISVVFPHTPGKSKWTDRFAPPEGRCKLRVIGVQEGESTSLTEQGAGEMVSAMPLLPDPKDPYLGSINGFVDSVIKYLDIYGRSTAESIRESQRGIESNSISIRLCGYDLNEMRFTRLVVQPAMFTEYKA
ncbi:hypothetical protein GQ53DRAFT_850042 [Thozetella sp. PMI_491]|nr:hypothetical protein GQ53DRAFT_850042 [Thozetella sp. PMI_491]